MSKLSRFCCFRSKTASAVFPIVSYFYGRKIMCERFTQDRQAHIFICSVFLFFCDSIRSSIFLGLIDPSDSCQGRHYHCQKFTIQVQKGKNPDLKRFSIRNWWAGGAMWKPSTSPWEWTFPCESIFKAGVHYQHNGRADGSSYHTGLSTLEAPSRWAALLGGRLRQRGRSGQGSRGLDERLTGSYQIFLDHN